MIYLSLFPLQVAFEDVLAEPDGVKSIDCVWKLSYTCFELGKNCYYKLATLLCGICMALEWGCEFGAVALCQVWVCTPVLREFTIFCGSCQKCVTIAVSCCCSPFFDVCGNCLARIKTG